MTLKTSSKTRDLTDNRNPWDFTSKYPREAWVFIGFEAAYLAIILTTIIILIALMIPPVSSAEPNSYFNFTVTILGQPYDSAFLYVTIAKFGVIGGCLFDIKWLIHSVARGTWHKDRILWRLFTPFTSGVTAVFFALIVQSGIISLFDPSSFNSIEIAGAFGMLAGYFADGVIGVLSNVAGALFGTVQDRLGKNENEKKKEKGTAQS